MVIDGTDWLDKIFRNKDGLRKWASQDWLLGLRSRWGFTTEVK